MAEEVMVESLHDTSTAMLNKVGLVIPTHCSNKGNVNRSWGPPSTGWIEQTIESLYKRCPDARELTTRVVLNIHSKPRSEMLARYEESVRNLCKRYGFEIRLDSSPGFRDVRLNMRDWFDKDYLFLCEHDWKWCQDIDLVSIIQTFEECPHINHMRFNKRPNEVIMRPTITGREGSDKYLIPDPHANIPVLHTPCFSNNPHIQRMSKYPEWCEIVERRLVYVGGNGGAGGFEHPLMEQSIDDLEEYGVEERNKRWGTVLYGGLHNPQVVKHIGL